MLLKNQISHLPEERMFLACRWICNICIFVLALQCGQDVFLILSRREIVDRLAVEIPEISSRRKPNNGGRGLELRVFLMDHTTTLATSACERSHRCLRRRRDEMPGFLAFSLLGQDNSWAGKRGDSDIQADLLG